MVIARVGGGVGNQMFQYAAGLSLSLRQGSELRLDPLELFDPMPRAGAAKRYYILGDYFTGNFSLIPAAGFFKAMPVPYLPAVIGKAYPNYISSVRGYEYFLEKESYVFDPAVMEARGNVYLDGGWLSEKYFKDRETEVRRAFAFKRALSPAAAEMAKRILSTKAVALHVRRGDRVWGVIPSRLHVVAPQSYYDRAIELIAGKVGKDVTIFVFSDEVEWCRNNLTIVPEHVFVSEGHAPFRDDEDLHLMSLCSHFIIPNSTFSWWGAWLSAHKEKVVVAPKDMFHNNAFRDADAFPSSWVRV